MPYIKHSERWRIEDQIHSCPECLDSISEGELNYLVTTFVREWIGRDYNYARLNSAIGVLESAKLELYRRMVAPYEDQKKEENGDVY